MEPYLIPWGDVQLGAVAGQETARLTALPGPKHSHAQMSALDYLELHAFFYKNQ